MSQLERSDMEWILHQKMFYTINTMSEAIRESSTLEDLSEVDKQIKILRDEEGWSEENLEPLLKLLQERQKSVGETQHASGEESPKSTDATALERSYSTA